METRFESTESFRESIVNSVLKEKTLARKIKSQIFKDKETFVEKMKNDLTPITLYSEMILEGKFGEILESQRKRIELMKIQAEKMFDQLNTIKDIPLQPHPCENQVKNLELKLELFHSELKKKIKQITLLQKEKKLLSKSFDEKLLKRDINAISLEINNVQRKLKKDNRRTAYTFGILGLLILGSFAIIPFDNISIQGDHFQINRARTDIQNDHSIQLKSNYLIQNLKGDTIDTWLSWRIMEGETLYVNIIDGDKYPEQAEIVKNTILSTESIELDDNLQHKGPKGSFSTYYLGWAGALEAASTKKDTEFSIPVNFEVFESKTKEGDVIIEFSNMRNGDGYSGFTKSIADDKNNQILKSYITIYEIESLSNTQLESTFRHEMGHALGLAHSTAQEDLMYPVLTTAYPYISDCTIDGIISLYDGGKSSQVICEK